MATTDKIFERAARSPASAKVLRRLGVLAMAVAFLNSTWTTIAGTTSPWTVSQSVVLFVTGVALLKDMPAMMLLLVSNWGLEKLPAIEKAPHDGGAKPDQ